MKSAADSALGRSVVLVAGAAARTNADASPSGSYGGSSDLRCARISATAATSAVTSNSTSPHW